MLFVNLEFHAIRLLQTTVQTHTASCCGGGGGCGDGEEFQLIFWRRNYFLNFSTPVYKM